jgi:protein ImuB
MLWLALHLPLLSLEAFATTLPKDEAARPLALVDQHRIGAVNRAAAALGLKPGIQRATALALAADLRLGEADPHRDAAALQAVAHVALAFTPMVTLEGAATVLLEVQPSLRYFGGLSALLVQLRQALVPLGHRVHIASAPTPLGAALLAQWSRRRDIHAEGRHSHQLAALQALLDDAPVWLIGPGREHWEALQGMGLQTLSDLRVLPRSGLARRFGEELLDDLDRALGRRPDPREALLPAAVFESRLELFARADTTAQVLYGAGTLLARLLAWAQAQQARIGAFTLRMLHEPRHRGEAAEATQLHVELAEPSLDLGHLQLLLRERLAQVVLAAPTLDLELHCSDLARSAAPNGELFPTRQSQAQGLVRLLERLRARLGDEQVLRVVAVADHRPERATGLQPVLQKPAPAQPSHPPSMLPLHRPLWLLPAPQPLAERDALPLLAGRPLLLLSGPERIESGWWDGDLVARDYFIAQDEAGALVWIYRGRLLAPAPGATWFLQGRFG